MTRKLRMGMFGGGKGAFIGAIHRCAAFMDNHIELVCGCFSSNPEKSLESGRELMLDEDRIYSTYQEMIEKEAQLPEDLRMDFISIVTPNHLHFAHNHIGVIGKKNFCILVFVRLGHLLFGFLQRHNLCTNRGNVRLWDGENVTVNAVKTFGNVAGDFQMLFLVSANRH